MFIYYFLSNEQLWWCLILNICTLLFQNEVKSHVFFASINWDDLVQKRIPPPFNPSVVNVFMHIFISLVSTNFLYFNESTKQWHRRTIEMQEHIRTIKKGMCTLFWSCFSCYRSPSMTYRILILSSQMKPYPTRCASARITPLSTPASWRLMMLFWAFPMLHLQMIPSYEISNELYWSYCMLPGMAWVCSFIQKAQKMQRPDQGIVHVTQGQTSCDAGFFFFFFF